MAVQSLSSVRIVEVGPRDGLQNIPDLIPTATKLKLIRRLERAGLNTIELTSVVSPRRVPQLADCREVLSDVFKRMGGKDIRLPVLVPNGKGLDIASKYGVKEVAVFISATEGFSQANINCSVEQGIERARNVVSLALKSNIAVRGYVSCIFADPYNGPTQPAAVLHCVKALLDAGCYEVSLGDTLGVGSPSNVRNLINHLLSNDVPSQKLAGHFHDTYGQAVANVWEAYNCGLRVFDSSVAGLGGCPFAPGAKGNVASEDLVYMFHNAGIETGIDLAKLVETGVWISKQLSKPNGSRAGTALATKNKIMSSENKKPAEEPPLLWDLFRETEGLQLHRSGVNLKITLNRPKNGNALTSSMISDLTAVVTDVSKDPQTSRIIITGTGKFFCTGMDLGKSTTPVAKGGSASNEQFERLNGLFEAIDQSPKVTIACLNGPAFGGGVGLAFSCDMRLGVRNASVTLSEVKLGLCPATISKYVIREWGVAFAREAMLSARPVAIGELRNLGLVSEVADDSEQLRMKLDIFLSRLKVASPDASRMSKELVRLAWSHAGKQEQADKIKGLFEEMMHPNAHGAYGVKAFQAGRMVDWDAFTQKALKSKL